MTQSIGSKFVTLANSIVVRNNKKLLTIASMVCDLLGALGGFPEGVLVKLSA